MRVSANEQLSRVERYADLMANGATLDAIGKADGITRERVRQILAEYPLLYEAARAKGRTVRAEPMRKRAEHTAERIQQGATSVEIAAEYGVSPTAILNGLRCHPDLHRRAMQDKRLRGGKPRWTRYSDEALEAWMQMFLAEYEPPYSSRDWSLFLRANGGPTPSTYHNRYGLWQQVAARFGFEPVGVPGGAPRARKECAAAVLRLAAELGRPPGANTYTAGYRRGDEPSEITVRRTLGGGSWRNVVHWLMPRTDPPPAPRRGEPPSVVTI